MKARLTFATVTNPNTGRTEPAVRASTKVGNRIITAQGSDDQNAIGNLKLKVREYETIQHLKATYPKDVEL